MAKNKQKKRQARLRLQKRRSRKGNSARPEPSRSLCELPLALCRVNSKWREGGAAVVVLARRREMGRLIPVFFYVDTLGVGVKDCSRGGDCSLVELDSLLSQLGSEIGNFEECSQELAQQIVWGGYYYGKQNGFRPPKEFSSCKKAIPHLSEDQIDWKLFGKDGKSLIIGDYDDLLRRSGGKFGMDDRRFHYIVGHEPEELFDSDPWEALLEEDEDLPPDKERLLFLEGTYFGNDFESLFRKLRDWQDLDLLEEGEEYALFGWSRPYPKNHWNPFSKMPGARQSLGQLEVEGSRLTAHVKGRSWMLIMNQRLWEAFGDDLIRGPLEVQDPMGFIDSREQPRQPSRVNV